ncbi:MAG: NAD-dependent epimerase/dehydratase family protein [Nocardioidaceae bacterium]
MRVFVTGATGVMGRSVVSALHGAGHTVVGLARYDAKSVLLRDMDVIPVAGDYFDASSLAAAFTGCDVVCNMATHFPVGLAGIRPRAWKVNDRIRAEGSRIVAAAAERAGVDRLIQESVSFLYADGGEDTVTETSLVAVNRATEPVVLAETHATAFTSAARTGVVLRFGTIVGDDGLTRWRLDRARHGHPIGLGDPDGWIHVVHSDDVGSAVLAALTAPAGIYNAGARPIRRAEMVREFSAVFGRDEVGFVPKIVQRLAGERLELLTRSQRVCSDLLMRSAAWKPVFPEFDREWLSPLVATRA